MNSKHPGFPCESLFVPGQAGIIGREHSGRIAEIEPRHIRDPYGMGRTRISFLQGFTGYVGDGGGPGAFQL